MLFWIDNTNSCFSGHLHVGDNIKMSKSLMNTISIKELLKSYTANQFRTLCLLSNYKNGGLNFDISIYLKYF